MGVGVPTCKNITCVHVRKFVRRFGNNAYFFPIGHLLTCTRSLFFSRKRNSTKKHLKLFRLFSLICPDFAQKSFHLLFSSWEDYFGNFPIYFHMLSTLGSDDLTMLLEIIRHTDVLLVIFHYQRIRTSGIEKKSFTVNSLSHKTLWKLEQKRI